MTKSQGWLYGGPITHRREQPKKEDTYFSINSGDSKQVKRVKTNMKDYYKKGLLDIVDREGNYQSCTACPSARFRTPKKGSRPYSAMRTTKSSTALRVSSSKNKHDRSINDRSA